MSTFTRVPLLIIATILALWCCTSAAAETTAGETLFTSMRCGQCHAPDKKVYGPGLQVIAGIYGEEEKLLAYFRGESEPIIEPERAKTMKPRLRKIGKLSAQELQALARYIMGFKPKQ
jgi:cytochrome c551/c552